MKAARAVDPLVRVRAEQVALALDERGGEPVSAGAVEGGERGREARRRDAGADRGGHDLPPRLARAVVASSLDGRGLLLADEPTGNLDTANSSEVLDLFDELHADGLTLVVITHDPVVSARAQRRVRISDGRLTQL